MDIHPKLLALIDEGYSFEYCGSDKNVRFYKHGSGYKSISLENMKTIPAGDFTPVARIPEDIIDSSISLQFLYFILEHLCCRRLVVINWSGWVNDRKITIHHNYNTIKIDFQEYEKYARQIKYDEFLPDILKPVSGIIQSYAHTPFYDFLKKIIKKSKC